MRVLIKDPRRNTSYAKEIRTVTIGDSRLERLYIKGEKQEEIRFSWWRDGRMMPRPLDDTEDTVRRLIAKGIKEGVLSRQFLPELVADVLGE